MVGEQAPSCARPEHMKIGAAECSGKPPIFGVLALSPAMRHCPKTPKNDVQTNSYGIQGVP